MCVVVPGGGGGGGGVCTCVREQLGLREVHPMVGHGNTPLDLLPPRARVEVLERPHGPQTLQPLHLPAGERACARSEAARARNQ
eukprot:COSAG01_NODE_21046_length_921_cov_0.676399_1_plen_83_part_10